MQRKPRIWLMVVMFLLVRLVGIAQAYETDEPLTSVIVRGGGAQATANGLFVIDAVHGGKIDSSVLRAANLDGILLEVPWTTAEASEGSFSWTAADSIVSQAAVAGKKVSLILTTGWRTPNWVYAAGAQKFNFIWDQAGWGPALCSIASIPVPWDAIYQAKLDAFVAAAGAHFGNNPAIASVKITGLTSKTQENFLPATVKEAITNGKTSCTGYDDVANWQTAGYTPLKVEAAWQTMLDMFARAFPQTKLEAMLIRGGFPPIDDNGNRYTPDYRVDSPVTDDFASTGASDYPAQFALQNDGLTTAPVWTTEAAYAAHILTGYQEGTALGTKTPTAISLALAAGASYLEFYEADALLPAAQTALNNAHQILQ